MWFRFVERSRFSFPFYLGSASDGEGQKDVFDGFLRRFVKTFRAFVSYFSRDHAMKLLNEV